MRPGGVVRPSGPETFARTAANFAGQAMEASQQIARVMTGIEVEEATALATSAAISLDENGVPQVDRSARERMSRAARNAFDKTLNARFRQRLSVAMQTELDQLSIQYDGDPEGFKLAATAAIEGMAESVPEDFQGYWQDEAARLGAAYGAKLGQQQMRQAREMAASDFLVLKDRTAEQVAEAILAGNPADADALITMLETQGAQLLDQGMILPHEFASARIKAYAARGAATIQRAGNEQGWTSVHYEAAALELIRGGGTFDGLFPDAASRASAASHLTNIAARLRSQEAGVAGAIEANNLGLRVASGTEPKSDEAQEALDAILGTEMEDWGRTGIVEDPEIWGQIIRSGYLPSSLEGAFLAASRPGNMDPVEREQVFRIWRTLMDGRAPDGTRTDLAAEIAPEVTERFMTTAAMMEFGGQSFEEADLWAQEFTKTGFNNAQLARQMRKIAVPNGGGEWDEAVILEQMDRFVDSHLEAELDSVILDSDSRLARIWFAKLIATDSIDPDDALKMLVTQVERRYVTTKGMYDPMAGPLARSWAAPEERYRVPTDATRGLLGVLERGFALSVAGQIYGLTDEEVNEVMTPWFDRWADGEIRKAFGDELTLESDSRLLERGEDYRLEAIGADRARPQYRVYAKREAGTWALLDITLDPVAAHEAEIARLTERDGPDRDTLRREETEALAGEAADLIRRDNAETRAFEEFRGRLPSGTTAAEAFRFWKMLSQEHPEAIQRSIEQEAAR